MDSNAQHTDFVKNLTGSTTISSIVALKCDRIRAIRKHHFPLNSTSCSFSIVAPAIVMMIFFSLLRLHWKEAAFRRKLSPDGSQQAGGLSEKKLRTKKWYLLFPPERQSFKSVGRTESAEWNGKLNKQIYDYLIRQFMGHNCRKKFYFTISYGFFILIFPAGAADFAQNGHILLRHRWKASLMIRN